jgi:hypothetical protein
MKSVALYTAIVFFCSGTDCGLISTSKPITDPDECRQEAADMATKIKNNKDKPMTIVDGRCSRMLVKWEEFDDNVCSTSKTAWTPLK